MQHIPPMSDKPGSNFNTKREKQGFVELKQDMASKNRPVVIPGSNNSGGVGKLRQVPAHFLDDEVYGNVIDITVRGAEPGGQEPQGR